MVLFDHASRTVYALAPNGQTIEFYKVLRKSSRDLIYAISTGPYKTRVYEGPLPPNKGLPKRIENIRELPDIDEAYLNPSARQKALWMEQAPSLPALELQR
jgi:hypothetical protein